MFWHFPKKMIRTLCTECSPGQYLKSCVAELSVRTFHHLFPGQAVGAMTN